MEDQQLIHDLVSILILGMLMLSVYFLFKVFRIEEILENRPLLYASALILGCAIGWLAT